MRRAAGPRPGAAAARGGGRSRATPTGTSRGRAPTSPAPNRLDDTPGRVGAHHEALRAGAADGVPAAPGGHRQLAPEARLDPAHAVVGAHVAAAAVSAAHERAQARVVAGTPVVERGFGEVDDGAAPGREPAQPILLVAP